MGFVNQCLRGQTTWLFVPPDKLDVVFELVGCALFDTYALADAVKGDQQDAFKRLLGAFAVFCKEYVLSHQVVTAILKRCQGSFKVQQRAGDVLMTLHTFFHFVVGEEDETVGVSMNVVHPATYFGTGGGGSVLMSCRKLMIDSHAQGLLSQLLSLNARLPFTATTGTYKLVCTSIVKTLQLTTDYDWFAYLTRLGSSTCEEAKDLLQQHNQQEHSWKQIVKLLRNKKK